MAYLDHFAGTKTVDLGFGHSAVIKEYLTEEDFSAATDALLVNKKLGNKGVESNVDTTGYQRILVLRSLVSWTLDDANGPMAITLDNLKRLPIAAFRKLSDAVNLSNGEDSPEDQARFRDDGEGSAAGA